MPLQFTCPQCGHQTLVADEYVGRTGPCAGCGETVTVSGPSQPALPAAAPSMSDDPALRMLVPVGRSGWAIAAGYAGLFALVCFPAPIALILGIVAILDIRAHPDRHGMGRAIFGLVMGILGSLGLLFGLIAAISGA